LDSLRKAGLSQADISEKIGMNVGSEITNEYVERAMSVLVTTLTKQAATYRDITAATDKLITYNEMIDTMSLLGDSANRFTALVMHSKPFFKLFKDSLTVETANVAGVALYNASVPTLGLPVIVTDSSSLVVADGISTGVNSYNTLFLTDSALSIKQSELGDVASGVERGKANLVYEVQGEYAYNIGVKGFSFSTGVENPTDAQLASATNWTYALNSHKSGAGAILEAGV